MRPILFAVFGLAACTTTAAELGERAPVATYTSQKSLVELESCLADATSYISTANVVRTTTGVRVINSVGSRAIVDTVVTDNGTARTVAPRVSDGSYVARLRRAIEGCI